MLLASLWWLEHNTSQPPSQIQLAEHAGTDPMMTSQVIRKLAACSTATPTPQTVVPGKSASRRTALLS